MKHTFENEGDEFREFIAENVDFIVIQRNGDGSVTVSDEPPIIEELDE